MARKNTAPSTPAAQTPVDIDELEAPDTDASGNIVSQLEAMAAQVAGEGTASDNDLLFAAGTRDPNELAASGIPLDPSAAEAARLSRKPNIDWLEPGVVVAEDYSVLPLFTLGDKIVIERYCHSLEAAPWLDTQTYVVDDMDDETGDMKLWNPDLRQHAGSNFTLATLYGDVIKLAPTRGNIGKKKRGRPSKGGAPNPAPVAGEKRGRGRPKGSKNRPKDVVAEEKTTKKAEREAKRAAK